MMLKAVALFLVAIMALGLFGKWRRPGGQPPAPRGTIQKARKCPACGTYLVGSAPCPCGRTGSGGA
jgi:hypothetical protein